MPELHGQPVDRINSVHRDPTTGQTWASVGERKIQVPAFPVSVGRRRSRMVPSFTTRAAKSHKCPKGKVWSHDAKKCVPHKIALPGGGDPLPEPLDNPMTVARGGVAFSPPATSQLYARVSNQARRRRARMAKVRSQVPCEAQCAHFKNDPGAYRQCMSECRGIGYPQPKPQGKTHPPKGPFNPCHEQCITMRGGKLEVDSACLRKCEYEQLSRRPARARRRRRNQPTPMGARAFTDVVTSAPANGGGPTGPGNTWTMQDALNAGCCVFLDGQGAYLTCDPMTTGGNHPLHGLEVQVQAVNDDIVTVCHQAFNEGCWRLPACPEEKLPSQCCVRLGTFPQNGLNFTGMLECTDPTDPLHGVHVMVGDPYQKDGQTYVSFDVGGDVTAELPVCEIPPAKIPPPEEQPPGPECCVVENDDGTVTLLCDPDPYGWNGLNITGAYCMDTQNGRMCAVEFSDAEGNQVQIEAPVCPKIPPADIPPECCVDATTTPPTLQQCSDPSFNGTPVDILDVDEQSGMVMVAVPWSSTPVPMPLCDEPPDQRCPPCPECPECPDPGDCPTCPPGYWMAPDGSCIQCPPNHLIDPATGQCVQCPPPGECPTCPPGTYLDTASGQCVTCPECPEPGECPECPPCFPPGGRIPPVPCCPDEDCDVSPGPRMPHIPQPGPVPGCDPDDPCCYECSLTGAGTVSNPCNPCRANRR